MSTPTPRTDSAYLEHRHWANEDEATEAIEDFRDLARKLETELAEQQWLHESAAKRAKELTKELATERAKVRTLHAACETICEEWGKNHDAPFLAGGNMEKHATAALAATEDAP